MAKRTIGDAVVTITYNDRTDSYEGSIKAGGFCWKFDELKGPRAGLSYASDSREAYTRMAKSAVSFGSYYTSHNRGDDAPDWAPAPEVADAIEAATAWVEGINE